MFALLFNIKSKRTSIVETNKLMKTKKQLQKEPDVEQANFLIGDNVQFMKNRRWVEAKIVYLSSKLKLIFFIYLINSCFFLTTSNLIKK